MIEIAPAYELTDNDYQVLVEGNLLAKNYARKIMGKRKLGRFLTVMVDPSRAVALKVTPEQLEQINQIDSGHREKIRSTRLVIEKVCKQYKNLTIKLAHKMASITGRQNQADLDQLKSEAMVGLLKAVRGYTRLDVKFFTYSYRAISNELSRYLQRNGVSLSGSNSKLIVAYKRCQEALFKEDRLYNFDSVCDELKLTEKQKARLKRSLSEVSSESDLEKSIANLPLEAKSETGVDAELMRRIESVPLSKLERDAWISQNKDMRGFFPNALSSLKAVAQANGNLTPQAACEALKRAKQKLAKALMDWSPQN